MLWESLKITMKFGTVWLIASSCFPCIVSLRSNTPYSGNTYIYIINGSEIDHSNVFNQSYFDSVIQCGVFCVSNVNCAAAFYERLEGTCMTISQSLDNFYMSPSYQDIIGKTGLFLYVDLHGWVGILGRLPYS